MKKKKESDEQKRIQSENQKYYDEIERQKRKQYIENRLILEKQINEDLLKKQKEKIHRQELTNTNYGPQETEEIEKLLKDKKLVEYDNMKVILMD